MNDGIPCAWSRTAEDLLAEVVMAATNHCGPFLIVEGPTDQRFLELKVDAAVYFVQAGGKTTCISLVRLLNSDARSFTYLGIADEDYDWIQPDAADNLVLTDTRDLESILVRSTALDSVIVELGDNAKVTDFIRQSGTTIRQALLSRALFFGRVRALGFIKGTVCLDDVKPSRFCGRDWNYNEFACAEVCVNLGLAVSVDALLEEVDALTAPTDWHFARGHDLVDILIGGLIYILSGKTYSRLQVESLLRQSMQRSEFEATSLFNRVSAWESERSQQIWRAP